MIASRRALILGAAAAGLAGPLPLRRSYADPASKDYRLTAKRRKEWRDIALVPKRRRNDVHPTDPADECMRAGGDRAGTRRTDRRAAVQEPRMRLLRWLCRNLRHNGFAVTAKATHDLAEISRKAGIPAELQGCHTSFIGDYVVDGHVPVEAIAKLLAAHPAIKGITLPGMPEGSPGMYGRKSGAFTIYAIAPDGKSGVFMTV